MPRGRPAIKPAITVDRDVHEDVVRAASEERVSVSAWMTAAARRSLRIRDGLAAVEEWEAQHGAFTNQELDESCQHVRRKHEPRPESRRRRAP